MSQDELSDYICVMSKRSVVIILLTVIVLLAPIIDLWFLSAPKKPLHPELLKEEKREGKGKRKRKHPGLLFRGGATAAQTEKEKALKALNALRWQERVIALSKKCLQAPVCLQPDGRCMRAEHLIRPVRPECKRHKEFCNKSVFKVQPTGLKITLPLLTSAELASLYSKAYAGQANFSGAGDWRPTQQASMIKQGRSENETGLTIVEMGCAAGYLLYNLRQQASHGGQLKCFEADPHQHQRLNKTFRDAENNTPGLTTEVIPTLFDPNKLQSNSVDIFLSSHALEHMPDPCLWMAGLKTVLKPGGIIFTEVPAEYNDPENDAVHGQYHLLYFNETVFQKMMHGAGFKEIQTKTVKPPVTKWGAAVRSIFQQT
eukprot:gnl/MRDRNA2_/MRDRNA2_184297_c0_seq1.p1 gnl/MRDRNA2_/MRDRNA2_184297_c0~~gnl/MRDRNA2_/MRDRNA2_184297_c0_seq1.p1  ORF type:complete len:415 (+),score=79.99 gnl/MRDRNA2_/MRDRNA2_184297_c0_seq1:132-1247(+)